MSEDPQQDILLVFDGREQVLKKSEIMERTGLSYHNNSAKHIGDVLTRMVNNGKLERVKKGQYRIARVGAGNRSNRSKDQLDLFD